MELKVVPLTFVTFHSWPGVALENLKHLPDNIKPFLAVRIKSKTNQKKSGATQQHNQNDKSLKNCRNLAGHLKLNIGFLMSDFIWGRYPLLLLKVKNYA